MSLLSKAFSLLPMLTHSSNLAVTRSDLIKLSDNLSIACAPRGPGFSRFVEVALG